MKHGMIALVTLGVSIGASDAYAQSSEDQAPKDDHTTPYSYEDIKPQDRGIDAAIFDVDAKNHAAWRKEQEEKEESKPDSE